MMGDLDKYPADPTQVIPIVVPPNNTMSVLGQETGHRWLVHFRYPFLTNPGSTILLGRDLAHWSFFFNAEASVMEGTESVTMVTGPSRPPMSSAATAPLTSMQWDCSLRDEVLPSFVVPDPTALAFNHRPEAGVTFSGTRLDVTMDKLIEANGRRLPTAAVGQRDFSVAFALVNARGSTATAEQIAKLEAIRQQWEEFWTRPPAGGPNSARVWSGRFPSAGCRPLSHPESRPPLACRLAVRPWSRRPSPLPARRPAWPRCLPWSPFPRACARSSSRRPPALPGGAHHCHGAGLRNG